MREDAMKAAKNIRECDAAAESMIAKMTSVQRQSDCVGCGDPVAPRSCYCEACEATLYADQHDDAMLAFRKESP
jgi:hypothetical protein